MSSVSNIMGNFIKNIQRKIKEDLEKKTGSRVQIEIDF
jgi:hypothetical protein